MNPHKLLYTLLVVYLTYGMGATAGVIGLSCACGTVVVPFRNML